MLSDFHFLVPEAFIQNLVQFSTVFSEKIQFELTLTFNTHISSYIQPIFRSLAAKVPEISTVFTLFPIEKPKLPNLTLP